MYPKRFRQRIDKAQQFRTQYQNRFISGSNGEATPRKIPPQQSQDLLKIVSDITQRFQTAIKQQYRKNKSLTEMEVRDHLILLDGPLLDSNNDQREKQIKIWLGDICKQIFSITFNYFSHKILDSQTTKSFSSQCILGNIITLSKINKLTESDFQLINLHLKNQILPYFLLRFPQSTSKQVNLKLNKEVSATDYLDTNQNNMFLSSKVKVQYRQNGIYYDTIMQFINYIIDLPQKTIEKDNTAYDDFNEKMQKLFTSVFNRKWTQTNFYDPYIRSQITLQVLKHQTIQLQKQKRDESLIKENNKQSSTSLTPKNQYISDKDYQETVKLYTSYLIGRKVSENVPKYSSEQIRHGNIKIITPSILRIIIKWSIQLQEKFQQEFFQKRNQPFVMSNGQQVEMTDQNRQKLCTYANNQWQDIKKFVKNIQYNIYTKQAELSYKNLMYYSTQKIPQYQQSVIKFANRNTQDVNHYAFCYLNRLIHGLMKISKQIYTHLKGLAEWPYPPLFITFTMGDLMRCRCVSRQKQIIRIYKQLEIQTIINPQIMRIVKVKNRLNKGTKDILINILFHQQILCQIQLAIKVDQSDFSLWSDKFNHYIYQLKRSTYGPVTQMCSIWSSIDERSSLFKNQKIRIQEFQHKCNTKESIIEILPFTCNRCFIHYSQTKYIYDHIKCAKCQRYWTCALCRINTLDEKSLISQMKQKIKDIQITRRITEEVQDFPEYFIGFQLESLELFGQKFRKFQQQNTMYIARIMRGTLFVKQLKKNDKATKKKLFQRFIFFQSTQIDDKLKSLTFQDIINQIILSQISQNYKKRSQTLRITKRNVTNQLLFTIKDTRAQSNIKNLSLPENNITSLAHIGSFFPHLNILNLNKNNIESLQGISQLKKLTDLYLGQNKFKQIIQLQNLIYLRYIQLGDNPNSPQFKCNLTHLINLQSLTLIRSSLIQFPKQICQLSNLKLLWLFENKIVDLPPTIQKLTNLQYLHMDMNQLTKLPQQLFQLNKLVKLMLAYNKIQQISSSIGKLTKLELLSFQGNPITKLPINQIMTLTNLQSLSLNKECQSMFQGKNAEFVNYC